MIQAVFLSTAVFFSVQSPPEMKYSDGQWWKTYSSSTIHCEAYQELQGWEWDGEHCPTQFLKCDPKTFSKDRNGNQWCTKFIEVPQHDCKSYQKILWRKLVGLCADGTVRWQELR